VVWIGFTVAAVAAGMPHSISGAFGFELGEVPSAKVAACEKNEYTLSDDEAVRLDRLDDAERLKAKGLNPSKL
jgi:hypothetical protein